MLLLWCWYVHKLKIHMLKRSEGRTLSRRQMLNDSARSLDSVDSDDGLIHE